MRAHINEHRHFLIVVALLTLLMTWPTAAYILRADVFWLPGGNDPDTYIKLWDIWYGKQVLTGQADRFHTDLVFFPDGVSLVNHPFFWLQVVVVGVLQLVLPLSNAYGFSYLLIVYSSALAAYAYLHWLLKDKWIALFGAVVFSFNPHTLGFVSWPETAWLAVFPLVFYAFHRGMAERRARLICLAGLLAGLTSIVTLYHFVQVVIILALATGAFAVARWREGLFWRHTLLLAVALAATSAIRLAPLLSARDALAEAMTYYPTQETHYDLITLITNHNHPVLGPLAYAIFDTPQSAQPNTSYSYLGIVPLALLVYGLSRPVSRRKIAPWVGLCLAFIVLKLGSTLQINGTVIEGLLLPKHYLDQLLPFAFDAFTVTARFVAGARLPLAVCAGFGLIALLRHHPGFSGRRLVLALIAVVCFEGYTPMQPAFNDPITHQPLSPARLAFVDWLDDEDPALTALINLPFGRDNAKFYNFVQIHAGYPQTEGAISRTPDSAYDYIRANPLLNAWYNKRPANCVISERETYQSSVAALLNDGFSHVVHHRGFYFWETVLESFRYVDAAYSDDYVSVYRLEDLLASCGD